MSVRGRRASAESFSLFFLVLALCAGLASPGPAFAIPKPPIPGVVTAAGGSVLNSLKKATDALPDLPGDLASTLTGTLDPKKLLAFAKDVERTAKVVAGESPVVKVVKEPLELAPKVAGKSAVLALQALVKLLKKSPLAGGQGHALLSLGPFAGKQLNHCLKAPGMVIHLLRQGANERCVVRADLGGVAVVFGYSNTSPLSPDLPEARAANPFRAPTFFFDVSADDLQYCQVALPQDGLMVPQVRLGSWFPGLEQNYLVTAALADRTTAKLGLSASLGLHLKTCVPPNPVLFGLGGRLMVALEVDPLAAADLIPKLRNHVRSERQRLGLMAATAGADQAMGELVGSTCRFIAAYQAPAGHELGKVGVGAQGFVEGGVGEWDTKMALVTMGATVMFWVPLQGVAQLGTAFDAQMVRSLREFALASSSLVLADARGSQVALCMRTGAGQSQPHQLTAEERQLLQAQLVAAGRTIAQKGAQALARCLATSSLELGFAVDAAGTGPVKAGGADLDAECSTNLFKASAELPVGEAAQKLVGGSALQDLLQLLATLQACLERGFAPQELAQAGLDSKLRERVQAAATSLAGGTTVALGFAPVPGTRVTAECSLGHLGSALRVAGTGTFAFFNAMNVAAKKGSFKDLALAARKQNPLHGLLTSTDPGVRAFRTETRVGLGVALGAKAQVGAEVTWDLGLGAAAGLTMNPEMFASFFGPPLNQRDLLGDATLNFSVAAETGPGVSLGEGLEAEGKLSGQGSLDMFTIKVTEYNGPIPQPPAGLAEMQHGAGQAVGGAVTVVAAGLTGAKKVAQELFAAGKSVAQVVAELKSRGFTDAKVVAKAVWDCGQRDLAALVSALKASGVALGELALALKGLTGVTADAALAALKAAGFLVDDLARAALALGKTSAVAFVKTLRAAGLGAAELGRAAKQLTGVTVATFVKALKGEKVSPEEMADAAKAFGVTSVDEFAKAMKAAAMNAGDVAKALKRFGVGNASAVATALKAAGFAVKDVVLGVRAFGADSASAIATALKAAGCSGLEIAKALKDAGFTGAGALARALKDAGFGVLEVADILKTLGFKTADAVADALKEAGFGAADILAGLAHLGHGGATVVVGVLKRLGCGAADILGAVKAKGLDLGAAARELLTAHGVSPQDLVLGLRGAGVTGFNELGSLLANAGVGAPQIAQALKGAGATFGQIASSLKAIPSVVPGAMANALKGVGATGSDILSSLRGVGVTSWSTLGGSLRAAGLPIEQIGPLLKGAGALGQDLATGLRAAGTGALSQVATQMRNLSVSPADIAAALKATGVPVDEALPALKAAGVTAWNELVGAGKNAGYALDEVTGAARAAGATANEVASALRSTGVAAWNDLAGRLQGAGFQPSDAAAALKGLGAGAGEVLGALRAAGTQSWDDLTGLLNGAQFPLNDMTAALKNGGATATELATALTGRASATVDNVAKAMVNAGFTTDAVATGLKGAGAGADQIAAGLKGAGCTAYDALAKSLKAAGFGSGPVAHALGSVGAGATDIARALKSAGWTGLREIRDALKSAGHTGFDVLKSALQAVGAGASDLLSLL